VILNFSRETSRVMLNDNKASGQFRNVFTNELLEISPFLEFVIDPWDFFVLEK
jgi:hypothetical protein